MLTSLVTDQKFTTPYSLLSFGRTNDNRFSQAESSAGSTVLLTFTSANQAYSVLDLSKAVTAGQSISFNATNRVAATSNAHIADYLTNAAGSEYELLLMNSGAGNDQLALTYSSIGLTLQHKSGTLPSYPTYGPIYAAAFSYGFPTASNAPLSNLISYSGVVLGEAIYNADRPNGAAYRVSGTVLVTVSPAGGYVAEMTLVGTSDLDGTQIDLGHYAVSLSTAQLSVMLSPVPTSATGSVQTYGPAAEEIGGALSLTQTTTSPLFITLAFAAKR